jgi:hypothetical protein
MDLNRLFHITKTFAELLDEDIELFLRERRFRHEHLNLEFKQQFPVRASGKYEIVDICKYIAGFSNEEGGVVIYGVADSIKDPNTPYPDYLIGLSQAPSIEDLSQWVTQRVTPLVQSPAVRSFKVNGKDIVILKIPEGLNRPYAYVEPPGNALTFFKKTAGGVKELKSDEVKELYWSAIIQQADHIMRAGILRGMEVPIPAEDMFAKHRERIIQMLEDVAGFGRVSIYCVPEERVQIPVNELKTFLEGQRGKFSEVLRFFPNVDVFQNGVSAGYFPRAIRKDIKSTGRVTLNTDGLVAWDSQADMSMDHNGNLQPFWLSYEIHRHLQLAKALLEGRGVTRIRVVIELDHIEQFTMNFGHDSFFDGINGQYTGSHERIERKVSLADIHSPFGKERNIVFRAVRDLMDEVCRIFGIDKAPDRLWGADGKMVYVKGLEGQR